MRSALLIIIHIISTANVQATPTFAACTITIDIIDYVTVSVALVNFILCTLYYTLSAPARHDDVILCIYVHDNMIQYVHVYPAVYERACARVCARVL